MDHIEVLASKKSMLLKLVKDRETQIEALTADHNEARTHHRTVTTQVSALQQKETVLLEQEKTLRKKIAQLKEQETLLEQRLKDLKVSLPQKEREQTQQQRDALLGEIDKLTQTKISIDQNVKAIEAQLGKTQQRFKDAAALQEMHLKQKQQLQLSAEELARREQQTKERERDVQAEAQKIKQHMETLNKRREQAEQDLEHEKATLLVEIHHLEDQRKKIEEDITKKMETLNTPQAPEEVSDPARRELMQTISALRREKALLQAEIGQLKRTKEDYGMQRERDKKLVELRKAFEQQLKEKQRQLQVISEVISKKEEESAKNRYETEKAREDVQGKLNLLKEREQAIITMEKRAKDTERKIAQLDKEWNSKQDALNAIKQTLQEVEQRVKEELPKHKDALSQITQEWDFKSKQLENTLSVLKDEKRQIEAKAKDLEEDMEQLKKQEVEALDAVRDLEKDQALLEQKQSEFLRLEQKIERNKAIKEQLERDLKEREKTVRAKEKELAQGLKRVDKAKATKSIIATLTKEHNTLKKQHALVSKKLAQSEKRLKQIEEHINQKSTRLREREAYLKQKEQDIKDREMVLKREHQIFEERARGMQTEREELEEEEYEVMKEEAKVMPQPRYVPPAPPRPIVLGGKDADMKTLINEVRELINTGDVNNAAQLLRQVEVQSQGIRDPNERRRIGYQILELKTELQLIKLA